MRTFFRVVLALVLFLIIGGSFGLVGGVSAWVIAERGHEIIAALVAPFFAFCGAFLAAFVGLNIIQR